VIEEEDIVEDVEVDTIPKLPGKEKEWGLVTICHKRR